MNFFWHTIHRFAEQPATLDEDGTITTYASLIGLADTFAERLGSKPSLVFLEASNSISSISAYLGCLRHGHTVYLFNKQDDGLLQQLIARYRPNWLVYRQGEELKLIANNSVPHELHPSLRVLLSTSGSTGSPKFVKLSDVNIDSNAKSIAEYLELGPSDRAVTNLKFSYSYGMSIINSHFAVGASLLLTERSVTEPEFWDVISRNEATSFSGVPHTYELLKGQEAAILSLTKLRYATQAGGKLRPDLVVHFGKLFTNSGRKFIVMYGQTEAAPRIAFLPANLCVQYPTAIGRAIPGTTIELRSEDDEIITQTGTVGELNFKGPNVMIGYAEDFTGLSVAEEIPVLRTGDLAMWNEAGLVEITGRASRFVKPFGLRVSLDEIEVQVRNGEPNAAVAGNDDFLVIALPSSTPKSTAENLRMELAKRYGLPPFIFRSVFSDELPRLANGKVAYSILLEMGQELQQKLPSAASRRAHGEYQLARNQFLTLLVSGIWHGAAWNYILWGAFHGLLLILQRHLGVPLKAAIQRSVPLTLIRMIVPIQILLVFIFVCLSRVPFRSQDLEDASVIFSKILTGPYQWRNLDEKAYLALGVFMILSLWISEALVEAGIWRRVVARNRVLRVTIFFIILFAVILFGNFFGGKYIYVRF